MNLVAATFFGLECIVCIFPAFPLSFWTRISILVVYFLATTVRIPHEYTKVKNFYVEKYNKYMYSLEDHDLDQDDYEEV